MTNDKEVLHKGHRQRLIESLVSSGYDNLNPHELLEAILFYAQPRVNTNETAHRLLAHFGSFDRVLDTPMSELRKVKGLGPSAANLIFLLRLSMRCYVMESSKISRKNLRTTEDYAGYLKPLFSMLTVEVLYVLCLDNLDNVIRTRRVAEGVNNTVGVSVWRICETVISSEARKVILAHNHPGSVALPSSTDRFTTRTVYKTLRSMGVTLLDHLIFAGDECVSMRDSGFFRDAETWDSSF